MGFGQRRKYRPPAQGGGMQVRTTDTGHAWDVGTRDGRVQASRDTSSASRPGCVVSGPASGLYLFLWNRSDVAQVRVMIRAHRLPQLVAIQRLRQLGLSTHGPELSPPGVIVKFMFETMPGLGSAGNRHSAPTGPSRRGNPAARASLH